MKDTIWWNIIKWCSTAGFVVATIMMISPTVAATAITPWVIYLVANAIWCIDSVIWKNKPWIWLSLFFCMWDVLLITSRLTDLTVFGIFTPIITILERLP